MTLRARVPRLVAAVVLATMGLVGPAAAATATVTTVADPTTQFAFSPKAVTVAVGDTVHWTNLGIHTVTTDPTSPSPWPSSVDVGFVAAADSPMFIQPGVYTYYCRTHGAPGGVGMAGTIVVGAADVTSTPAAAPTSAAADFDIPGGHFFTQTGGGGGKGYAVTDDAGGRFWSELQRLGGVQAVGFPASQRFQWDGFTVQVFQRVIFQWHPEQNAVVFVNVFDRLHDLGKDDFLMNVHQIPPPRSFDDAGKPFDQVEAAHLAVLDPFPALKAAYFGVVGDPVQANGLPTSDVVDEGSALVVRAQRVALQQWKVDQPFAKAGQVTVALGGDIAKEAGILPDPAALQPTLPP